MSSGNPPAAPTGGMTPFQLAMEGMAVEQAAATLCVAVALRAGPVAGGVPVDPSEGNPVIQGIITEVATWFKSMLGFDEAGNRLPVDDPRFTNGFPLPTGTPAPMTGK